MYLSNACTGMQGLHVKTGTFFLSKQWSHEYQEWLYNWWSTWNINRDPFSLKEKKKSWSVKKSFFFSDIFRFFQSLKIVLLSFSIVDLTSFINYEMVKYMEDIPSFHICHLDLSKLDQNAHVVFDWCTVCDRLCFHGNAHEWWGSSVQRPPLAWVGCHAWRTNSLHLYWFSLERFDLHWDSFFLISWMP